MTEETKQQLLTMINKLDEGEILTELTQARDTLYFVLKSTITEIIDYDNSEEENEAKIDRLFNQKEKIEQSIHSLSITIKKLADQILENIIKKGETK
jgi:predicted secreted protein